MGMVGPSLDLAGRRVSKRKSSMAWSSGITTDLKDITKPFDMPTLFYISKMIQRNPHKNTR